MDDAYEAYKRSKRRQTALGSAEEAAKSGGLSGAILGGAGKLIGGERTLKGILKAGAAGGVGGAALAGGATLLGSSLLGAPEEGDPSAYTHRGGLGGLLGGGALGGGVGYLLGRGKLNKVLPTLGKLAEKAELPTDNVVVDALKKWASTPGETSARKSAALLGLGLGAAGGMTGSSEGMQQDYLENEVEAARRARFKELMDEFS